MTRSTLHHRGKASGVARRRALAIEPLESRTLLSGSGFGAGTGDVARTATNSNHLVAVDPTGVAAPLARFTVHGGGATSADARGFAWRFNGGFGGGASQLAASRTALFAAGAAYGAYPSNVDRAFDLMYDSSQPGWKLIPSATPEQMPHDKWTAVRPKDNGMPSMSKGSMMGGDGGGDPMSGDRMGGDADSMQDMGNGMDGKMSADKMRPVGSLPLVAPVLGGATAIGAESVDSRGEASNGDGGFIALSSANSFSISPAVDNFFTQTAQRVAPSVVLSAESGMEPALRNIETADSDAADGGHVDSQAAQSGSARLMRGDEANASASPARTRSVEADVVDTAATAATDGDVERAVGDDGGFDAIVLRPGVRGRDDSGMQPSDESVAAVAADETNEATGRENAWAYDEPEGGMIALAVAYLPGEVESPRPSVEAWLVEDARPRGDGETVEARFESSVGLYQVFDVATTMPPNAHASMRSRQVIAAVMPLRPRALSGNVEDDSTSVAVRSEAAIGGIEGWFGPNYAMAAASALAFSAGVTTLHGKRPLATARRFVERFRDRAWPGDE